MFEQILSAVFMKKPREEQTVGKTVFAITCAFRIGAVVIDAVQFDTAFQLPEIIDGEPFSRIELPYLPAHSGE